MDVAVIGIDGLDPNLLSRWRGDLPTLDSLMKSGSYGRLRSSYPPLTAPAWPTMFTGKQGGKHGVFGFTRQIEGSYRQTPVNYSDVKAESVWEALDAEGVACGVVNVPLTYPPSDLDHGFVIAGWPAPSNDGIVSDPDVRSDLEAAMGERYRGSPFPLTAEYEQFSNERLFGEIRDGLQHHRRAFVELLSQQAADLDVFFGVFMAIDIASHNFAFDEELLKEMYIHQDEALKMVLEALPDDTNVVVMSDHGHGVKGEWSFHVNEWLRKEGFLATMQGFDSKSLLERVSLTQYNLVRLKNATRLGNVRERLPQTFEQWLRETLPLGDEKQRTFQSEIVDWEDTVAYSPQQNNLYLNTMNSPQGTVEESEYNNVLNNVVTRLEELEHPEGGRPLVSEVNTKGELFEGPYTEEGPDVVFIADEMGTNAPMGMGGEVFSSEHWGEHRKHGVLLTSGPSFATVDGERETFDDIKDVFPLVLALAEAAVPENVDGEIPDTRLAEQPDIEYRTSRDKGMQSSDTAFSEAESDAVREQLEGLGYLE